MKDTLNLQPGSEVWSNGNRFIILNVPSLEWVLAKDSQTGQSVRLQIIDLAPPPPPKEGDEQKRKEEIDLALVDDEDWKTANFRMDIIRPVLDKSVRTTKKVEERARLAKVDKATIYRWIDRFEATGKVSSLLPLDRSGGRGKSRLPSEDDKIIDETIKAFYLKKRETSIKSTIKEVNNNLKNAGKRKRHPSTIRKRIAALSEQDKMGKFVGVEEAKKKFSALQGSFPGADYPLAVVQIDHTDVDLILVDDVDRLPIGKPFITLAIDVFSRIIPGFYISLDPPNTMSVALCLSHAMIPKEKWLAKHGIDPTIWPVWGKMTAIHADNAREFRGNTLSKACGEYGIDLIWRAVGKPEYGGHIERLTGTLMKEIHELPGTTFSNIQEKGDYDSEKKAVMTFSEFETWLAVHITQHYHQAPHSELLMSPIKKYEKGIFGTDGHTGRGLPPRIIDEQRLKLDFMPYYERTVQRYGIELDKINYYNDSLSPWVEAKDPEDPKKKRKFLVRRDPRDISLLYFYDPRGKQYYEIPYRNTSHPPMSIWELREITRRLKEDGIKDINEDLIFDAYERKRTIENNAVRKTKKMRRDAQRRKMHKEAKKEVESGVAKPPAIPQADQPTSDIMKPFDDLEITK